MHTRQIGSPASVWGLLQLSAEEGLTAEWAHLPNNQKRMKLSWYKLKGCLGLRLILEFSLSLSVVLKLTQVPRRIYCYMFMQYLLKIPDLNNVGICGSQKHMTRRKPCCWVSVFFTCSDYFWPWSVLTLFPSCSPSVKVTDWEPVRWPVSHPDELRARWKPVSHTRVS